MTERKQGKTERSLHYRSAVEVAEKHTIWLMAVVPLRRSAAEKWNKNKDERESTCWVDKNKLLASCSSLAVSKQHPKK